MVSKSASWILFFYPCSSIATEFTAGLTHDLSQVVSGGLQQDLSSRFLASIAVSYDLNPQTQFYLDTSFFSGQDGSEDTGDIQAYSNIDNIEDKALYQAWLYHRINPQLSLKLGVSDANADFAVADNAVEFINSSMGLSPSISYLPTYPEPTLGLNIFWQSNESNQFSFAIFSDDSNQFKSSFYIGEYAFEAQSWRLKLGIWYQQNLANDLRKDLTNNRQTDSATGYFAVFEGELSDRLSGYIQLGASDEKLSEITQHLGAGLVKSQPFGRADDVSGLGVSYITTSRYTHDELKRSETAIEWFYKLQLNEHFSLKPDIQFIINPAANILAKDALVFSIRSEFIL